MYILKCRGLNLRRTIQTTSWLRAINIEPVNKTKWIKFQTFRHTEKFRFSRNRSISLIEMRKKWRNQILTFYFPYEFSVLGHSGCSLISGSLGCTLVQINTRYELIGNFKFISILCLHLSDSTDTPVCVTKIHRVGKREDIGYSWICTALCLKFTLAF